MFEINKMIVRMVIVDDELVEKENYAVFGNILIKIDSLDQYESEKNIDENDEFYNIYMNHIVDAQAVEMKKYLHDIIDLSKDSIKNIEYILSIKNKYNTDELDLYRKLAVEYAKKEKLKNSMLKLDKLAYFKAQKLLYEDKINDELSKKDE